MSQNDDTHLYSHPTLFSLGLNEPVGYTALEQRRILVKCPAHVTPMKRMEGESPVGPNYEGYQFLRCSKCSYQKFHLIPEPFWKCHCGFIFCRVCALTYCIDPILPLKISRPYLKYDLQRQDADMNPFGDNPKRKKWPCQSNKLSAYIQI